MSLQINSKWFGTVDLEQGYLLQEETIKTLQEDEIGLLAGEHFEVLSLGKSLWKANLEDFQDRFDSIHKTVRGGKATLHNPGQLIIYPLLNLRAHGLSLKDYVRLLIEVSNETLHQYGMMSHVDMDYQIGVYFNSRKIVSVGLRYDRGWIKHGLSINIENNLEKFTNLDVCGCKGMQVTSLKNEGIQVSTQEFYKTWKQVFKLRLKQRQYKSAPQFEIQNSINL